MRIKQNKMRLGALAALGCAAIFAVITFILEPISVFAVSDITVSKTVLPRILDIILDLTETAAFAFCYSVIIFASVTRTRKSGFAFFGIYAAACFVRRASVLGITLLTYNYIDSTDIFTLGAALIFEYILALAVTLVAVSVGMRYRQRQAEVKKAARIAGDSFEFDNFNFTSVFSSHNPLQLCMLIAGIILSFLKLGMRIRSDIKYTSFYGAPSGIGEILIMIVYYLSDIFVCAIFYALSWLIMTRLQKKYSKEQSL